MNLSISPGKNNVGAYINDINLKSLDQDQSTEIKNNSGCLIVSLAKMGHDIRNNKNQIAHGNKYLFGVHVIIWT